MYETMPSKDFISNLFEDEMYTKDEPPIKLPGTIHLILHQYFRFRGLRPFTIRLYAIFTKVSTQGMALHR
jgi:hypothetical protein